VIELQQNSVAAMALELTLLVNGLAEVLHLKPSRGPSISLRVLADDRVSKAIVSISVDESVNFSLGRNQAEYLQAVLLRAYRDQVADVNHVHIEGAFSEGSLDFTVVFGTSRKPMSADEAEKLLRD
jgi:hypothetical protein